MKTNNNKGFTLIELIMVIVILGILAAVAVPKFFDVTTQAHNKNKQAVVGNVRSGLQLFAANKLVVSGTRSFPAQGTNMLDSVLDESPEGWSYSFAAAGDADSLIYSEDPAGTYYEYVPATGKLIAKP